MTQSESTPSRKWYRHTARQRRIRLGLFLLMALLAVASWYGLDLTTQYLWTAPREMGDLLARMYPPDYAYLPELVQPTIDTINISILGTLFAIILAAPVAVLGAETTTINRITYFIGKFIISASRSVNVIIWALIMVVVFGPGVVAGIAAIAVRSIGFCAKILAESIEEINFGSVEAIRATGASRMQVLIYGIISQIKPAFITVATLRWDINVRGATVLGLVGAGGIGVPLQRASYVFAWRTVAMILIIIGLLVIVAEGISITLRKIVR